ncbi:MAG: TlpA family protein disulfide reductase [Myxococcales bacterium]|nr:TlpA family protein disulfide reductase [Myxococcales bacterium]
MAALLLVACASEPLPEEPRAYAGGWPVAACDLTPSGTQVGDVIPDFTGLDQFGDEVHLHDFCDKHVLLTTGAFWCRPCLDLAERLESLYREYQDRGLFVVTLMYEDYGGLPPDLEDLQQWADRFDLTTPVLADPFGAIGNQLITHDTSIVHTENFLTPGMVLHTKDDPTLADADVLDSLLPSSSEAASR